MFGFYLISWLLLFNSIKIDKLILLWQCFLIDRSNKWGIFSFISQWFLRPTQDLDVLHRRQEVIRFFTSPQNSDAMSTLQSLLRNISNIPVLALTFDLPFFCICEHFTERARLSVCVCVGVCIRLFYAGCLSLTPKWPTGRASIRSVLPHNLHPCDQLY